MTTNPYTYAVQVTGSPTLVIDDETEPTAREDGRVTCELYNLGPCEVWLGGDDVSDETGIPLPVNASRTIAIRLNGKLYGLAYGAAEVADVRVLVVS